MVTAAVALGGKGGRPRQRRRSGRGRAGPHPGRRGVGAGDRGQPDRHLPHRQARDRPDAAPGASRRPTGGDRHRGQHRRARGDGRRQLLQRVKGGVVIPPRTWPSTTPAWASGSTRSAPGFIDTPMTRGIFGLPGMEAARATWSRSTSWTGWADPRRSPRRGLPALRRRLVHHRSHAPRSTVATRRAGTTASRTARPHRSRHLNVIAPRAIRHSPHLVIGMHMRNRLL